MNLILSLKISQVEAYDESEHLVNLLRAAMTSRGVENMRCYQGDCHQQLQLTHDDKFDLILGSNLIDRLHTPLEWIRQSKV